MKRTTLLLLVIVVAAMAGGMAGALITVRFVNGDLPYESIEDRQQMILTNYTKDSATRVPKEMDFLHASERVVAGVVHIRASYGPGSFSLNPLEYYYDQPTRSSGSGVIISDDGYIVTNNHVIENATNIEVVMNNNQRYYAKLIGTDPSTDLALLKIKARNLPFVPYGNSDAVRPGEWVLAVGNPFDLNSTVTAGIVSAKARNIRILRDRNNLQVEAFIQTDAAVNPGNSGGALVNLQGELVGINTAIATATGSYSGYSFAIPVSLVKKVMDDLLEFGQVQRGLLGIQITDVNAAIAEELSLTVNQGVLVSRVNEGSAAAEAGIKAGDVIVAINKNRVASVSELQEWVARNRPGTTIYVDFLRGDEKRNVEARLKNNDGVETLAARIPEINMRGLEIGDLTMNQLTAQNLDGGVVVENVGEGIWKESGLTSGIIIAFIDKVPIDNVEDFKRILEYKRGGILLEGVTHDGKKRVYGVDWR